MKKIIATVKTKVIRSKRPLITASLLALVLVGYQNCQQQDQFFVAQTDEMRTPAGTPDMGGAGPEGVVPEDDSKPLCEDGSSTDLICNPLGGGDETPTDPGDEADIPAVPASKLGLIAQLYEGENQWNNMDKYLTDGYKHQEYIYFSNFNVPTRSFDEGFGFGGNDFLKNRFGEKLIEWFAIQARGHIVLPESEESGAYHIVTISDDGIRVEIDGQKIINNPNVHAPIIDCAANLVQLNAKEEKDFQLTYFQGPRYHIALMTFIKKIDDPAKFKKGSFCSSGSSPDVLTQNGYKVISPAWFTLPKGF